MASGNSSFVCSAIVASSIVASSIVASSMVERHNGEHSSMTTCEKETRAIKFGRFVTYIVRTKLVKWGKKRGENPNGTKPFPNWHAKKITGGSREGSLQVGSDEVLSCGKRYSRRP